MKKDWSKFVISCTAIHKIMTYPKGCNDLTADERKKYIAYKTKGELSEKELAAMDKFLLKMARYSDPDLSEGSKKYLISRYSWDKYNRGTLPSPYKSTRLLKGIQLEVDGIDAIERRDKHTYTRGEDFQYNSHLFGKCDLRCDKKGKVIDVKVSWGIHGFLPHHITKLSINYWMQMQGYLDLYGVDKGEVSFVLLNTPQALIDREKKKHTDRYMLGEIDSIKFEELMENLDLLYDYSKIPEKRKIITFEVYKDKQFISSVYKKVEKCRQWLSEFDKIHTKNKRIVTSYLDYKNAKPDEDNS